jgi:hypothetical protein
MVATSDTALSEDKQGIARLEQSDCGPVDTSRQESAAN